MKNCLHAIKIRENTDRDEVIRLLAREQFRARDAYYIENSHTYNIDAGMNDVRAVVEVDSNVVTLCCRDKAEVGIMDSRIVAFAAQHPELCGLQ